MTDLSTAFYNAYTKPPVDDGDINGKYAHDYLGRHAAFTGRRYRRGKNRCWCGAPMDAPNGPPDPFRHLSPCERIVETMMRPSPLWKYLKRR